MSVSESESDHDMAADLVNKLFEYGDSMLDEDGYREMKKKTKTRIRSSDPLCEEHRKDKTEYNQKRREKKKKSKLRKEKGDDNKLSKVTQLRSNALESWACDLGLNDVTKDETFKSNSRTVGSKNDVEKQHPKKRMPEVIVFEDHKRKKKRTEETSDIAQITDGKNDQISVMSLKDARKDVRNFGISGFSYRDRRKLEEQRAIKLGAKAPKKQYINYKKYMEMLKGKRESEMKQREVDRKMGYKVAKRSSVKKNDILGDKLKRFGFWRDPTLQKGIDGQPGKFKHGIQLLKKDEIESIKKKQVSKR
ncbi:40S small subunit processome assembly factor 1-like [Saccoglossus kowalevskii]|uniref:Uncharacterized protein C1orf131 homolog n=1 Tax=Saccoglossus kowalevskii TaxID=10224 RepID=A0ABM0GMH1_SACKO|nr:PREDICTED: uncharacterized protein C1orf131 homolog [Saccoglossus kowalevskii]